MLTKEMVKKLNDQINLECLSSNIYMQMSSWCDNNGYEGAADFLYQHAQEELNHMHKLFKYVNETGAMAVIGAIPAPATKYESLKDVFEKTFKHEQKITKEINGLVDYALREKDYATFNFLQWYVAEQHEEERIFMGILDKISMMDSKSGSFFIDSDLKKMGTKSS